MKLQLTTQSLIRPLIVLKKIETSCPFCHGKSEVKIIIEDKKLFVIKNCPTCGIHRWLLSNNPKCFKRILEENFRETEFPTNKFLIPLNSEKLWKILKIRYHSFLLSISEKCNSDCNICYMDNIPHKDISFKKIRETIDKLGKGKNILLFGGEPTVRKDLFKIIKYANKTGNRAIVFTNGLELSNKKYVKKLKQSGISEIRISFDGFREEIYQILRNDKTQLYKKLLALKYLKEMKIPTTISFTAVDGINIDQIPLILLFAIKFRDFIRGVTIIPFTPEGRVKIKVKKILSPIEVLNIVEESTLGKIKKEYVHEFNLFKDNVIKILFKLHLTKNTAPSPDILFKIGSIKELISANELKKINKNFSQKNYLLVIFRLFKSLLKEKEAFKIFLKFILNKFKLNANIIPKNVLSFYILPIGSYFYLPGERETVNINFNPPHSIVYTGPGASV